LKTKRKNSSRPSSLGHLVSRAFYERDPSKVARELLGKMLARRIGADLLAGRIVETEAYLGVNDLAAHSAAGETARNSVLFGPAGHAYVYFTYGMYHCLNISCEQEGYAGCVLIRALEPLSGIGEMARARKLAFSTEPRLPELKLLTSGPGRLCQAIYIIRAHDNGKDVTSPKSDLQIFDDGYRPERIQASPRIGITKSVDLKLRFSIAGNRFVSGKRI
jgi:DNA-3-methyladenine glycosylase